MASIKLNNLAKSKTKSTYAPSYTYVDLHLDLEYDKIPNLINTNNVNGAINNRDLKVSPDEYAIRNSLINLFNTAPGQRILIPEYGCDLTGYLFQPCTKITANAVGTTIEQAILTWEPRVQLRRINVMADPENHQFEIDIIVIIPSLKFKEVNFAGVLSNEGFKETNNSEYI